MGISQILDANSEFHGDARTLVGLVVISFLSSVANAAGVGGGCVECGIRRTERALALLSCGRRACV